MISCGTKRITVSKSKWIKKNGTVNYCTSSGVMNFFEEPVGEKFAISENADGTIDLIRNGEGKTMQVRQAAKQRVISIGSFVKETKEYEMFKTGDNYLLKPLEGNRLGHAHEIIVIKERKRCKSTVQYFTLSKILLDKVTDSEHQILKITETYLPKFEITVQGVAEKGENWDAKEKCVRFIEYDNTSKTLIVKRQMRNVLKTYDGYELEIKHIKKSEVLSIKLH